MAASRPRAMPRYWRDDEEMAKKDDDLRLPAHSKQQGQWQSARAPRRKTILRLAAYAFAVLMLLFVLSKALGIGSSTSISSSSRPGGTSKPLPGNVDSGSQPRTYNAAIKFPNLAATILAIGDTGGNQQQNRNVLFAAASLRSAAELLPMACQMARERESYVHFVLISRSDIPMKDLLKINGVDESCKVIVHDARPDYPGVSTETRMALSSARALYHIEKNMHPQAIMIDSTDVEESYFLKGFRDGIRSTGAALIELPEKPSTRLSWITKLDSASLAAWNKVNFDILIWAPSSGSGNLRRVLKSLTRTDLGGLSPPHITIEIPHVIGKTTETLLAEFQWPPGSARLGHQANMLALRRRIPRQKLTEEESSARFLESFWPHSPHSHVLVLSPHVELSPQFFHYVKYSLLRHRYSRMAIVQDLQKQVMGMSFSTPTTLLDTSQAFPVMSRVGDDNPDSADVPFLWQGPSSDAMLFVGDKWAELHAYVSHILEKQDLLPETPAMFAKKEVSKNHPAWLEFVLQLSRIRGYLTMYPGQSTADAIIGVHSELEDIPEEYQGDEASDEETDRLQSQLSETFDSGSQVDMLTTLPQGGVLHLLTAMPVLSWDAKASHLNDIESDAAAYRLRFRRDVGQCDDAEIPVADKNVRDLFCKNKAAAT